MIAILGTRTNCELVPRIRVIRIFCTLCELIKCHRSSDTRPTYSGVMVSHHAVCRIVGICRVCASLYFLEVSFLPVSLTIVKIIKKAYLCSFPLSPTPQLLNFQNLSSLPFANHHSKTINMRVTIIAGLLAAFATTLITAQEPTGYANQSAPFYLVLKTETSILNGRYLVPCHEGAATEALCLTYPTTNISYSQFFYNTSTNNTQPTSGLLTWNMPYGTLNGTSCLSVSMGFQYNDASNVVVPMFEFGLIPKSVAFADDGKLVIPTYQSQDDTKSLPNHSQQSLTRWYVCITEPTWYIYQTLAWVMGEAKPQNPTCQKVQVYRKWV
jgi:hypothetical protein